jgi:hypothetical protein
MDQVTSADQGVFRNVRQRRENPDLDRHHRLPSGSNRQKKLNLPGNLHTILQILEVNVFEKRPIIQVESVALKQEHDTGNPDQLKLFNF